MEAREVPAAAISALTPAIINSAQQAFAGPLNHAGYDLSLLFTDYQSFTSTAGPSLPSFNTSFNTLLQVSNGSVVVDVLPVGDAGATRSDLESLGFRSIATSQYVVSGWLPISSLESAAAMGTVRAIEASYRPITSIGSVDSQGPRAQQSDSIVNFLGLDGTGKTVGVISDSFGNASADVASGDLPGPGNPFGHLTPVNVIDDSLGGTDEGRAMLQIVHDTAPGAKLAFATGGLTQTQFSDNIIGLANSAVNVIVDDFQFLAEPMFLDGIVAKAVDQVVGQGIPYFAAAGNNGRAAYQQAYRNSGVDLTGTGPYTVPAALSPTFIAHDFDPGAGTDYFQTLTLPAGITNFSFQWSDPFASVTSGGALTNMNLAVFDMAGSFIPTTGGFTQNVNGDPVEVFTINNTTGAPMQVQFAIGKESGPDPTLMKYVAFQPAGQTSFSVDEFATNSGTIYGHANAAGAEAIGAANYSKTPPFGTSPPQLEAFSSRGGTPILYAANGGLLPTPQTRQSPDLVAPDGVKTTFFGQPDPSGGSPSFFGTSAAAPHAAGVAALLLQAKPGLNVAQLYSALESTAIDMDAPGYDSNSGWGLVNATAAVISLNAGPYLVTFEGTGGNDTMLIRRDLTGNAIEFVRAGTVQFSFPATQVANIKVNGRDGGDALTIDSRNGAVDRAVAFDGGNGTDSFFVLGTADLPNEINAFSDTAAIPTVTFTSGTSPRFSIKDVEGAVLDPANGVVNLIGDDNAAGQADAFGVRGTGQNAFTATLNGSPPIQFLNADSLNVYGRLQTDVLTISPWASNSPSGWGVQTFYDGGTAVDGDLIVYNTVAANPVSEVIAIQPATAGAGEIRVVNASDSSAIAIISYTNTDISVNDTDGFATDTDTLTLRGTNASELFSVDLTAPGTASQPMVDVRQTLGGNLYKLRSFTGFAALGIVGYGGSDTVDLHAGRDDGKVTLDVDLGLPDGGPNPSDRDRIQIFGIDNASDSFHFTPGSAAGSGLVSIARATASVPTLIDFHNVEVVGFAGGSTSIPALTGADHVGLDGTNGSDSFTFAAMPGNGFNGQIDGGPILDITNLGSTGSTIALAGLDGSDSFDITQVAQWGIAGLTIDGGPGTDAVAITGTTGDDRYTWTASTRTLGLESPYPGTAIPLGFSGVESILVDAIGHNGGDRLVLTDKIGYTPTANSGTVPTDPPLSYRNVEFFTTDQVPTLRDDAASTNEDSAVFIDVLANDTGLGDGSLTITIPIPPTHGSAVVVGNLIRYTPTADYNNLAGGPDSFTYQVEDANGDRGTAHVTVSIAPVNDQPIANSQNVTALEDGDTNFMLTGSDGDPEVVQQLTFHILVAPSHGTILAFDSATGMVTYRAAPNYSGPDSLAFQVTDDTTAGGPALTSNVAVVSISVQGVNDPPVANGQGFTTNEDTPIGITLTGDDGDPEVVQVLTFTIVSAPQHGSLLFNNTTGKGTYTPVFNYNGPDFFTFTVTDDAAAGGAALTSQPATVNISVTAVNDPPVAISQTVSVPEDGSFPVALTANDGDPEAVQVLTYALVSMPQHGLLSGFNPATGQVLYTPDANFAGGDLFTFIVTDDATAGGPPRTSTTVGTIVVNVIGSNDAPSANAQSVSLAEDSPTQVTLTGADGDPEVVQVLTFAISSSPQHGTISNFDAVTGKFIYTPDSNFNGTDSLTFTVTDDATAGGPALTSSPAAVVFAIAAVNDRPTAGSQSVSVVGNKSIIVALIADDGDPELVQNLTIAIAGGPAHGTLTPLDTLHYLYRPNPAFIGSDSFTFTATDDGSPSLTSTVATVSIDVTKPPDGLYVTGAGEGGGPHVEAFNARTGKQVASFFAYDPSFTGGVRVAVGDVNNDGVADIITGAGVGGFPHVKVFSGKDNSVLASFFAFDRAFAGGITVASGDIDGLPGDEIVVGAGAGGGPNVRTFKWVNGAIQQLAGPLGSFFAYEPTFSGGVNVAVGNFDGLPGDEIITGAGMFGGPRVNVFAASGAVLASFFAFPDDGRLGVSVAAGDVDGDGKAEILTGSGLGGGPVPRLFDGGTAALRTGFAAFDQDYRGGINVGTVDADGDGKADLLIAPGQVARSLQVFDGESLNILDEFDAYSSSFLGGVYIAGK